MCFLCSSRAAVADAVLAFPSVPGESVFKTIACAPQQSLVPRYKRIGDVVSVDWELPRD